MRHADVQQGLDQTAVCLVRAAYRRLGRIRPLTTSNLLLDEGIVPHLQIRICLVTKIPVEVCIIANRAPVPIRIYAKVGVVYQEMELLCVMWMWMSQ